MSKPKIKLNHAGIDQLSQEATEVARSIITEVRSSHAGRPESEVRKALDAAAKKRGLRLRWSDEAVAAISSGDDALRRT